MYKGNFAYSGLHLMGWFVMYPSFGNVIWDFSNLNMSVVKGLSAVQGCPFRGVPLHNKLHILFDDNL